MRGQGMSGGARQWWFPHIRLLLSFLERNEVSHLGESIHDYPDRITSIGEW